VSESKIQKWHLVNEQAAKELTALTSSPNIVYPVGTNGLPDQLLRMPGVSQYYVSGYTVPVAMPDGKTVGAQMVVARSEGLTTKNYNYYLATHTDGRVYFAGPEKGVGHHLLPGDSVDVNGLLTRPSFTNKTTTS
jgi:hypothetical protein